MAHGHLWPVHPKPFPDELLSSWFVRVAEANGIKLQTLSWMLFGYGRSPWHRDLDRRPPTWFLDAVCARTPPPEDPCDKKLSQHEIDKLQNGGIDVHAEKEGFGGPPKYFDLYKCKNGDIVVKRKGGGAIVQRTGLNIKNF